VSDTIDGLVSECGAANVPALTLEGSCGHLFIALLEDL